MAKVYCPGCNQLLEHDRGHLPLHMVDLQRGQLVTGSKVCEFSNRKIVTDKAEAEYTHDCPVCGLETSIKVTEEYPGAFTDGIKPFLDIDCMGCSVDHDGFYCSNPGCGLEVVERAVEFYRVSDSVNRYLPKLPGEEKMPAYRDFDTEVEASTYIETLAEHETGRYGLDAMEPGWYETPRKDGDPIGTNECRASLHNPKLLLMSGGSTEHQGVFKAEFHKTVRVTDGHVISEEPDAGEAIEDTTQPAEIVICDCCHLARPDLPFTHETHVDGRPQTSHYCQQCEDAGCDLIDCNVRTAQRAAAQSGAPNLADALAKSLNMLNP